MNRPMCTVATLVALALLMVPAIGAEENPACANMPPSALPPPDWYVAQCSGVVAPDQLTPGPWRVPGDPVYFVSLFSTIPANARRLLRAPIPTFTYTNLGPSGVAPLSLFALDFDNAANVLWAVDSGCNPACVGRNFGTIDQATGAFTVMGAVSAAPGPAAGSNFAGLRFDPTDGTAYIATITPGGISELWTLNLTTGAATLRGTMAGGLMIDIAFDNMGQLYAHNISNDTLNRVDKTNGAVTLIGPTGQAYNFAQGMDFDASDNTLYLFGQTGAAGVAHFGRANLTTGAVTILANGTEELEGAIDVPVAPAINLDAVALTVDSAGNGVIEPSEMVVVAPTWHNNTPATTPNVTGTFSNFTGPAGGTYTIVDANGVYGNINANADATCASPTDCYTVQASAATRPAAHWDTSVTETLNVGTRTDSYTLHIGCELHRLADHAQFLPVHRDDVPPRDHGRLRGRALLPGQLDHARADVGARAAGAGRARLHPAGLRAAQHCSRTCPRPASSAAGSRSWRSVGWSRAAAAATSARSRRWPVTRCRCSCCGRWTRRSTRRPACRGRSCSTTCRSTTSSAASSRSWRAARWCPAAAAATTARPTRSRVARWACS